MHGVEATANVDRSRMLSASDSTRLPSPRVCAERLFSCPTLRPRVSPTGFGAGICRSDRPLHLPKRPRSRSLITRGPCSYGDSVAPPDQPQCASAEGSRPRMYKKETYRTAAPPPPALGPARGRSGRSVGAPEGPWQARTSPRQGPRGTASTMWTAALLGLTLVRFTPWPHLL